MVDFVRKAMKHLRIGTPEPQLDAMSPLDLLRVYGHVCNGWGHYSAQLAAIRHFCQANNMLAAEEETMTARVVLQDDRAVALAAWLAQTPSAGSCRVSSAHRIEKDVSAGEQHRHR